ncbi:hypothetical protein E2C01_021047 [Portunus trituberculatus]|uniref:Uncharacterized protein n=1 Tax=Portunus trituberculatus TaxID=210409 RepID=A0A5B7E1P7_PORTR|nr:hypothetical protein [Portunus trituberculatus]
MSTYLVCFRVKSAGINSTTAAPPQPPHHHLHHYTSSSVKALDSFKSNSREPSQCIRGKAAATSPMCPTNMRWWCMADI